MENKLLYFTIGVFALIGFQEVFCFLMNSKYISNYLGLNSDTYAYIFKIDFINFKHSLSNQYWDPSWLFYLPFNLVVNIYLGIKCYSMRKGKYWKFI